MAGLLSMPATAAAEPGYTVRPGGTELFVDLGDRGSYELLLETHGHDRLQLKAEQELMAVTEYRAAGKVSSRHIEVDLGDLGQIDVEVHLAPRRSQTYPPSKNCKGPASVSVPGRYRGTIEFAGEGDIPAFTVARGAIEFTRRFRRVCKKPKAPDIPTKDLPSLEFQFLEVHGSDEGRTVTLKALNGTIPQDPELSFGFLTAEARESTGELRIKRRAVEFVDGESFIVSKRGKKPETVKVKASSAFAGRALYSHEPHSPPSWTGDLSVDLPGAEAVPLVGPGFEAAFCRGVGFDAIDRCSHVFEKGGLALPLRRVGDRRENAKFPKLWIDRCVCGASGAPMAGWRRALLWRYLRSPAPRLRARVTKSVPAACI